jgi:kynurenine formamidase
MEITFTLGNADYVAACDLPYDISIPVCFGDTQLSVFGAPPARREVYAAGGFIGNVAQGGSCNCDIYHFAPHTSGTHTECVGHITDTAISVSNILQDSLIPATLVTLTPQAVRDTAESYDPLPHPDDMLLTRAALVLALHDANPAFLAGLIIRTHPNLPSKMTQNYNAAMPPYFSIEAMEYLRELNVKHLLVDIPSIDRLNDEGKLTNHHIFWDLVRSSHRFAGAPSPKTVTELIYVRNTVADGCYLLNIQLAPLVADAAPSRPLLYEIRRL